MSTLNEHETPARVLARQGSRFWLCELDPADTVHAPHVSAFGVDTVGIVDELAGGIIAYAHRSNAVAILAAIRERLGEV